MQKLKHGQTGAEVTRLQEALNDRSRARGLPQIAVDGDLGPETAAAVQRVGRALGALESTLKTARVQGVVSIGLQRIIRWPASRTPAQLARARSRARKAVRQPAGGLRIVTRSTWGARAPRGPYAALGRVARRVVHHTAFPSLKITSPMLERAHMRVMQGWHFARGFSDLGYHYVVFPSGRVYEGRPASALGAGVAGHNTGSIHVSFAGNFEFEKPTPAALAAAKLLLDRWDAQLVGHYQLQPNACPGSNLKPRLKELA